MSAPYTVVNSRYERMFMMHESEPLSRVIALVNVLRMRPGYQHVTIHGDNVDEDCRDGLSREERDQVREELV